MRPAVPEGPVSVPDWLEAQRCRLAIFQDRKLCFALSLLTQVYRWSPAIYCRERACYGLESRPGVSSNSLSRFMLQKPGKALAV